MATDYANVEISCPSCGCRQFHEIEYLIDSGRIPRNLCICVSCDIPLNIEAVMDISVEAHQ